MDGNVMFSVGAAIKRFRGAEGEIAHNTHTASVSCFNGGGSHGGWYVLVLLNVMAAEGRN